MMLGELGTIMLFAVPIAILITALLESIFK